MRIKKERWGLGREEYRGKQEGLDNSLYFGFVDVK